MTYVNSCKFCNATNNEKFGKALSFNDPLDLNGTSISETFASKQVQVDWVFTVLKGSWNKRKGTAWCRLEAIRKLDWRTLVRSSSSQAYTTGSRPCKRSIAVAVVHHCRITNRGRGRYFDGSAGRNIWSTEQRECSEGPGSNQQEMKDGDRKGHPETKVLRTNLSFLCTAERQLSEKNVDNPHFK